MGAEPVGLPMMTTDQALHGSGREPATVRVAMWSARHRWPVVAALVRRDDRAVRGQPGDGRDQRRGREREPERAQARGERGLRRLQRRRHERPVRAGPRRHRRWTRRHRRPGVQGDGRRSRRQAAGAAAAVDGVETPTFDQLVDPFEAPPEAGLVSRRRHDGPDRRPDPRRRATGSTPLLAPVAADRRRGPRRPTRA